MLKETVSDALRKSFGDAVHIDSKSKDFAIFAPKHPSVGKVVIEEDYGELIVSVGDITHGHFGSYESGLSEEQHAKVISDDLVDFLQSLFADQVLLFKARWGGGWTLLENEENRRLSPNRQWFKWSGPVNFNENS